MQTYLFFIPLLAILSSCHLLKSEKKVDPRAQLLKTAMFTYSTDCGKFPTTDQGYKPLLSKEGSPCDLWGPVPYIEDVSILKNTKLKSDGNSYKIFDESGTLIVEDKTTEMVMPDSKNLLKELEAKDLTDCIKYARASSKEKSEVLCKKVMLPMIKELLAKGKKRKEVLGILKSSKFPDNIFDELSPEVQENLKKYINNEF